MSERRLSADGSDPDNQRSSLIDHVLLVHIQQQLQGEHVADGELLAQYPELMPELADRLQFFREIADQRAANVALDSVIPGSDIGFFNIRCPHCRATVKVPAEACLIDVTCSGCGSHFSLANESEPQDRVATSNQQLGHSEVDQFLREARAAAQLRHPNIVTIHEVGRDGETVFLCWIGSRSDNQRFGRRAHCARQSPPRCIMLTKQA